jgi:hypothetical protein
MTNNYEAMNAALNRMEMPRRIAKAAYAAALKKINQIDRCKAGKSRPEVPASWPEVKAARENLARAEREYKQIEKNVGMISQAALRSAVVDIKTEQGSDRLFNLENGHLKTILRCPEHDVLEWPGLPWPHVPTLQEALNDYRYAGAHVNAGKSWSAFRACPA